MKRIMAVVVSVTLMLASCPIGVYAAKGNQYFGHPSWGKKTIQVNKWNKYQPVKEKADKKTPKKPAPQTPTPEAPVPDTTDPGPSVPETPVPENPVPEAPVPETPVPEVPEPEIPEPEIVYEDVVSLIAPPKGLTPAKGDGSDETKVIQAIFDYATSAHKTILIPKGYTFVVDQILIYKKSDFTVLGYGTLKHKAGATDSMIKFSLCSDFVIEELNTDGNVAQNSTSKARKLDESEELHSVEIVWSGNFKVGRISDINPAADSLYINDIIGGTIDTLIASADEPCGRNGLSIIRAEDLTINNVICENIGASGMPGGIDLEPNNSTDDIRNVVIKSAKVRTAYGDGIAITNQYGSKVENIEINGEVTKYGNSTGYVLKLNNVKNFRGNIKVYQEGAGTCTGARISGCNGVQANLDIYNANNGIDLGVGSSNIYLTGKITKTKKDGISIWEGLKNSTIEMDIKEVGTDGRHGVIQISEYGSIDNVTFKGDYSYSGSGQYCFLVDGMATNCSTEGVIANGWPLARLAIGDSAAFFDTRFVA